MKVAILSPFIHPVCEPFVGGTEAFIYNFATSLSQQGVEVMCYACEGSVIPGVEIRSLGIGRDAIAYPRPAYELNGEEMLAIRALEDAVFYRAFDDILHDPSIDLVHNHSFSGIPIFLSRFLSMPVVHTLHLPPMLPAVETAFCAMSDKSPNVCIVAVSHAQARLWKKYYPIDTIVYNGTSKDVELFPVSFEHNGDLLFAGRIDPTKGVEDAITVASILGKKLHIYGAPQLINAEYFESNIQPLLTSHGNVTYHGLVDQQTLFQAVSRAQALLLPTKCDESFGMTVIEAASLGTPAIMYNRGSAHEIVLDDINGYVTSPDNIDELAQAVIRTEKFDRLACASYTRERFSLEKCTNEYINLFHSMLSNVSVSV